MDVGHKINRERIVVLGWGRAILLQLAHPMVAAGVADHSGFADGRLSRLQRLHATVGAMLDFTFGSEAQVRRTAARINAIHDRVCGQLHESVGRYSAGQPYTATDPALLLWVHATLLDSIPQAYERFVGPLTASEKDAYCAESARTGALLRIPPDRLPRTADAVDGYVREMLSNGRVVVGSTARRIARDLLYPPLLDPTRPGAWLNRLVTLGQLPVAVRQAYGFPWKRRHDRLLRLVQVVLRRTLPLVPRAVRFWPAARQTSSRQR